MGPADPSRHQIEAADAPRRGLPRDRVAGAPISWGVCEVQGWGHQLDADRVLSEMAGLGLSATEKGPPGFLPDEPAPLREALAAHGLGLVGGFLALALHRPGDGWREALMAAITTLARAGGEVLVLAAAADADDYEQGAELSVDEWGRLLARLDEASTIARDHGMTPTLHPHVGTVVERPEHSARVLDGCDVPLCVDTGHVLAGDGDPLALVHEAGDRVAHVHLKDVDAAIAEKVAARRIGYHEAVRAGLYRPLGDGDVPLTDLLRALEGNGYAGWYVLEQDLVLDEEPPPGDGPAVLVGRSLAAVVSPQPESGDLTSPPGAERKGPR